MVTLFGCHFEILTQREMLRTQTQTTRETATVLLQPNCIALERSLQESVWLIVCSILASQLKGIAVDAEQG